jgi:multiple sugar transport system substrate-binding protein
MAISERMREMQEGNRKRDTSINRFILLALAAMLMLLAACSKEEAKENDSSPVVLRFVWWGSEQRKADTMKVIEMYQKANPGVEIRAEAFGNTGGLSTQLTIDNARQDAPDIIQGDYGFVFNYIDRKLFEPLDSYSKKGGVLDLSDVEPSYLDPGRAKDGKLYAVNVGNNTQTFLYNPKILEEHQVALPQEGYTVDEFYNMLKELKAKVKTPGFAPLGNMVDLTYYLRAKGGSMYNAEGTGVGYADDAILADYFKLNMKWASEGLIYTPPAGTSVGNNKDHPLATGKTAFYSIVTNAAGTISSFAPEPLKLLPYPVFEQGQEGKFIKPSMFLSVSAYSKHKEEAAKFISFFINNEEANDVLNAERGVPVSSKIAARLLTKLDEGSQEQYKFIDYLKTHSKPIDPPAPKAASTVTNAYNLIFSKVKAGTLSPEEGAAQYRAEADKILNRGRSE